MTLEEKIEATRKELVNLESKYSTCLGQTGSFGEGTMEAYANLNYMKERLIYLKKQYKLENGTDWKPYVKPQEPGELRLISKSGDERKKPVFQDKALKNARISAAMKGKSHPGQHTRWHTKFNVVSPTCKFCQEEPNEA